MFISWHTLPVLPGKKRHLIICLFVCRYDMEAIYFDEGVRTSKRQQLESKLLQVFPIFLVTGAIYALYQMIDVPLLTSSYLLPFICPHT